MGDERKWDFDGIVQSWQYCSQATFLVGALQGWCTCKKIKVPCTYQNTNVPPPPPLAFNDDDDDDDDDNDDDEQLEN